MTIRIDPVLKKWYNEQGASEAVRAALIRYFEEETNSTYIGTGK